MSQSMTPWLMSFHGKKRKPAIAVMRPPVLKEIFRGARFAMSFAGETTFAAMFTDTLATPTPMTPRIAIITRVRADEKSGSEYPGGAFEVVIHARIFTGSH